jgi:hypothetical protein
LSTTRLINRSTSRNETGSVGDAMTLEELISAIERLQAVYDSIVDQEQHETK